MYVVDIGVDAVDYSTKAAAVSAARKIVREEHEAARVYLVTETGRQWICGFRHRDGRVQEVPAALVASMPEFQR